MTGMRCAVRPWEGHDALQLCAVGKISAGEEIVRERPLVKVGLGPYRYGTYPLSLIHI